MASGPPGVQPVLSERADIHKSCKSLESLVNAFNGYCEAVNSVVGSQKKLVKTLRETAGLKATGEIAAKTLNASASMFDVMLEINTKFGQIADKEFDDINSELKKWFKKLAKEEKAHDDKINAVNIQIKHAGQLYEIKSKKNAGDASEENTRYINLISTLGPEISQEKHNHALLVTQKHTLATNSVAACLSRIADMEWLRSCEEVRRFASKIGQLGEWRALCEGGWTGAIPQDLPSLDEKPEQSSGPGNTQSNPPKHSLERQDSRGARARTEQGQFNERAGFRSAQDAYMLPLRTTTTSCGEPFLSRKPSFASFPSAQQSNSPSPSRPNTAANSPKVPFVPSEKWTDTVGSVTSLSSFPCPPAHVPDTAGSAELDSTRSRPRPLSIMQEKDTVGSGIGNITESKIQTFGNSNQSTKPGNNLSRSVTLQPMTRNWSPHTRDAPQAMEKSSSLNSNPNSTRTSGSATSKQDGEYVVDEFRVSRGSGPSKPKNVAVVEEQRVERRDSTASANSIVAAIRGRYASIVASPSKDAPQLSFGINELISRYQSTGDRSSPHPQGTSPITERQPRSLEIISPRPSFSQEGHRKIELPSPSPSTGADTEDLDRLRGQQEAVGEQEQSLKGQAHVDGQQEIEMRIRGLEKGRNQSFDSGNLSSPDDPGAEPRATSSTAVISRTRYSYSTTQLISPTSPPPPSSFANHPYAQSRGQVSNLDHAPFCGCATCPASKYKTRSVTPTPYDLRPPEPPISLRPEKPRGWIRRITVPVGHAFSLDSKKSISGLKNGVVFSAAAGEDGKMRRSYEQGGISTRSLTNFKFGRP